jgi:hypothetical protein
MAAGDEGVLTLSIGVRVSPEPVALELLQRYRDALNYVIIFYIEILLRDLIYPLE